MKWPIFGDDSRLPVYILIVGDLGTGPEYDTAPILCTTQYSLKGGEAGYSFYASQRFVDHLYHVTEEEELRLTGRIRQAVILNADMSPRLVDGGLVANVIIPEESKTLYSSRWNGYYPGGRS